MQQASLHMFNCKTALYNILIISLSIYPSVIFHSLSLFSFMQCILSGSYNILGLPWWHRGTESTCQFRRCKFNPFFKKIPWRRKWQPTAVFLSGKPHVQRSLVGYSPWNHKRVRQDLATKQQLSPYTYSNITTPGLDSSAFSSSLATHDSMLQT